MLTSWSECPEAPVATTNAIQLIGSTVNEALTAILQQPDSEGWYIGWDYIDIKWNPGQRDFWKGLHKKVLNFLRELHPGEFGDSQPVRYDLSIHCHPVDSSQKRLFCLFPCLKPTHCWNADDLSQLTPEPAGKILATALNLRVKLAIIHRKGECFDIPPVYYQADLLFSARESSSHKGDDNENNGSLIEDIYEGDSEEGESSLFQDEESENSEVPSPLSETRIFNALYPVLHSDGPNRFLLTLHQRCYLTESISDEAKLKAGHHLVFESSEAIYKAIRRLDARKSKIISWMTYMDGYSYCRHYAQHLYLQVLEEILRLAGLDSEPVLFQGQWRQNEFLEVPAVRLQPVIIVDNSAGASKKKDELLSALKEEFGEPLVVDPETIPDASALKEGHCYLFINESKHDQAQSGEFITDKGKVKLVNDFVTTIQLSKSAMEHYDYYTKIKRSAFDIREEAILKGDKKTPCAITQGIEIRKYKKGRDRKNEINIRKRCRKEFELKQQVGQGVKSSGIDFSCVDGQMRISGRHGPEHISELLAMYVRRPRPHKEGVNPLEISRVELALSNNKIKINAHQIHSCLSELSDYCLPLLKLESLVQDRSFLLWDKTHKVLLHSWTDDSVPMVLGSPDVNPIELIKQRGEDRIRKDCTPETNPTPYHYDSVIDGQREHIYIQPEQSRHSLLIMTTRRQRANKAIERQNRVWRIATYDINGESIASEEQAVTYTYLATFTREVLRNGEISKSSILAKIARLYLEN